jgi:hypothetical protein
MICFCNKSLNKLIYLPKAVIDVSQFGRLPVSISFYRCLHIHSQLSTCCFLTGYNSTSWFLII